MAMARGIASAIQFWDETTYGVKPGSPSGERAYFRTNNVSAAIARAMDETLSGKRGMAPSIFTQTDVQGDILTTLAPQSCAKWLKHMIGVPVISTIGTAKQFVYSLGGGALPAGFGMECDYSSAIATPGRFLIMNGCRISKGAFKFNPTGFIDATYSVRGASFDLTQTTTADATPDDFGHTGFSMAVATMNEGGGAIADVREFTLNWDNDLDDSLFTIGGGGIRGDLPEGFVRLTGTVSLLFKTPVVLNKAKAGTESALKIMLSNGIGDGTAGNEYLDFNIPNLFYDFKTPPVTGPKGLVVDLNWSAHYAPGADLAASATLKAMRATA